ncbi:uncharacterized protein LOC107042074 [Diachasma alloeum]|uniref:uncharacterized protein LOC107042074 n=1 Tax=Diachasma alloeum TaxID=454923 RepID=UPI0007383651|nr:uncharacterized protein LOC107042074 [Diachasma alloeum]
MGVFGSEAEQLDDSLKGCDRFHVQLDPEGNVHNLGADRENTSPNTGNRQSWSIGAIKELLDLYNMYVPEMGPMKKFKTKKKMFQKIAETLNSDFQITISGGQCLSRYKTVLREYSKARKLNMISGASRQDVDYEVEIEELKAADDSLEPKIRMGVGKITHVEKRIRMEQVSPKIRNEKLGSGTRMVKDKGPSSSTSNASNTVSETLLFIDERREEKKDQRHKEKLDLFRELLLKDKSDG